MSILIKGMEMPTDPLYPIHATIYADGTVITGHGVGEFAKEAVSVPTPHGRLIDADALPYEKQGKMLTDTYEWGIKCADIDNAPTIIEAEESE